MFSIVLTQGNFSWFPEVSQIHQTKDQIEALF